MKKSIKIKFIGFWPGFNEQHNFFTEILEKRFNVVICDDPDYVFCSVLGQQPYEECNYDGIRIHYNGENYTPDFNIHDYGISFNNLTFGDRHLEYPLYLVYFKALALAKEKHLSISEDILKDKPYFCNFIYGVSRDFRDQAFRTFNGYKPVMSPGTGNNNMPDHPVIKTQDEKLAFQKQSKFTIAFDSTQQPGFVTEKILHAFASRTIPVYFGDPLVGKHFNKKAFIDVSDYDYDLERVLKRLIEIDQNDELYLSILREPVFNNENYLNEKEQEFEDFLIHIFDQDYERAFRRSCIASPHVHNERLKNYNKILKSSFYHVVKSVFNW